MSLIHICHVYKCRNQELKKKKDLTLPPLHSSSQWRKYLHAVYLWIQTICSVENMNRWVFHMHRDRMPVWCTCDHTRALMSSDLYMSIRISSESPLKIAWMRGGCGDEKEQSRDHYGRYKRLWSFPRYEVLPMCAVLKAAACTKTADCTQKKCKPSLTSYISRFSVRQRNYCGKFLVDTHHKNKKGLSVSDAPIILFRMREVR